MKFFGFIVVISLLVNFSTQIPKFVNCPADFLEKNPSQANGCGVVTCHGEDSISGVDCGVWQCVENREIGYTPSDNTKPYPDCCGGPICSD